MNDPTNVVDQVFIAVLRLTQQLNLNRELVSYAQSLEMLANQLSSELDGDNPLSLIWVGMTIQGILEELSELVDIVLDLEDEALVMQIDETIEIIMAAAFGHTEESETESEGEDYGS